MCADSSCANRKGISGSAAPYKRAPPSWVKQKPNDVVELVCRLARKGNTPSSIGALLRDGSGVPAVKSVTGKKITRILKAKGLAPSMPEDLYYMIKKAVQMRKHLEKVRAVLVCPPSPHTLLAAHQGHGPEVSPGVD